jgi:hypothetical protein
MAGRYGVSSPSVVCIWQPRSEGGLAWEKARGLLCFSALMMREILGTTTAWKVTRWSPDQRNG